ncbi:bifunctional diguanylate cyclase/phosphodiesterase [Vogesella oryzae]|uniref:bifunctional diguanylate cyclase/phosphodiesterase n=1 Tax=Vogesella oryzae TaxID=1735285 RepID=UPI001FEAF749|nr:EAL domain-containing protein [Vogesella oryzae]
MNSTADFLFTPEEAAEAALDFLARLQAPDGATVWGKIGTVWHCLARRGDTACLPKPDKLHAAASLPDHVRLHRLGSESAPLGWLLWHGQKVADELTSRLAYLLSGHLLGAGLNEALSTARLTHHILLEISRLASEADDLATVLPQLHQAVRFLMPADNFYIALHDENAGVLRFPYFVDQSDALKPQPEQTFPARGPDASLTAWLIRENQCLMLGGDDLVSLCRREGIPQHGAACDWWMGMPLSNGSGRVMGAMVIQGYHGQPRPEPHAEAAFLFVGHHISAALDRLLFRADLEKQVWRRTTELETANARLRAEVAERQRTEQLQTMLFRMAELSNTSLSMEAFFAGLHRLLAELIDAGNCQVALYDLERDELSFPYCADLYQSELAPRAPGRGPVEQVLHSGRPLLLADARWQLDGDEALESPPCCWLGVPLYSGSVLRGVLSVQSYTAETRYSWREQEILEFVANHIGSALARVQALDDLQRAYADLEQRVRERTTQLDAVNAQLQHDSLHDPLTKLPNRNYFGRVLKRSWDAFQLDPEQRFAVLFIDLDRFKLVNDSLGHLAGDLLLIEAAQRIQGTLQFADFLARLGGDEFAVLLSCVDTMDQCEEIARQLVASFERPIVLSGREVFTTVSLGVVLADKSHYSRAEDMLRDADHAMYRSKQRGRHGYTLFNQELRRDQADQLALEAELRHALTNDYELVPYYQAIVDSQTGRLAGFETLVRWHHPQRGMISPSVFMPMAEESGLILKLDRYMIERSCAQLAAWYAEGRLDGEVCLHINLSSTHFHDRTLLDWLLPLLRQYGLPAGTLHLEVTESALIDVPDLAIRVMQELKEQGICLALDDFGTGYSALSYLHRYQFDVLKIDQSFVREVHCQDESAAIVRAILALAAALGLEVVAEGVETPAQVQALRELGCTRLQGYYFARPAPAAQLDWDRLGGIEPATAALSA